MQGSLLRTVDSCQSEIQLDMTVFKFEREEMILKYMSLPRSYFIFSNFLLCGRGIAVICDLWDSWSALGFQRHVRVVRKDGKQHHDGRDGVPRVSHGQNRNIYYAKFFFEKVAPFCSTCLAYLYYATFPLLGYMIVSCVFFLTGAFFQLGKKSNDTIYIYCRSSASTLDSLW
jgi:hypothetical protein